ncbi:MAG: DUF262 domain-containing protein [Bacteroidales bacterium]|jgi:uncharacterized protein with ParB-like and HNH nuclease domain
MEFKAFTFSIKSLIDLYEKDELILDPPYQRNFIWSKADQEQLIDSILNNYPLPNLFFLKKEEKLEVVDGQQRIRTIINYHKGLLIPKNKNQRKENIKYDKFLNYILLRIEITSLEEGKDFIEDFYTRVNKTGLKLNKPELNKAEYFYTEFLALNQELASCEQINELDIFTDATTKRMNDIDFISELVALLNFGIYDKKDKVEELYDTDITPEIKENLKNDFIEILDIFIVLNTVSSIKKSRYKQRNDFFTLFGFIKDLRDRLTIEDFIYIYNILILIQDDISPSNEFCPPFREYALNCVSQSNSKPARSKRLKFLHDLFLNKSMKPSFEQAEVMKYYEINAYKLQPLSSDFNSIPLEPIRGLK